MQEYNISVSCGSEQTSVYLSLKYLDQDGIILNTDTRRFGIRANVESLINDSVTVGGRMSYISQKSNEPYYPSTAGGGSMARIFNIFETSAPLDRKSTRLNSSHVVISYAVFCLIKK